MLLSISKKFLKYCNCSLKGWERQESKLESLENKNRVKGTKSYYKFGNKVKIARQGQAMEVHAYNTNYLGGRDRRIYSLKSVWAKTVMETLSPGAWLKW